MSRRTKKNIHSNIMIPKVNSHKKPAKSQNDLISSLLNKNKQSTKSDMKKI